MNLCRLLRVVRAAALEPRGSVSSPRILASGPSREFPLQHASDPFGRWSKLLGLARCLGATLIAAALTASAQGQSSLTLAWNPGSGSAIAGYRLYEGAACRTYTNVINVGNVTTKTVTGLVGGATYFFAVTAYNTNGQESDFSGELSYTVPLPTNTPPTIALTAPVDGASFAAPVSISLAATVTANGHTIIKVQFSEFHYINGILVNAALVAECTSAPYTFAWSNVSAGSYTLTCSSRL